MNHLLREVNPFSKLRNVWNSYAGMISRFLSIQYTIIIVMCCAGLVQNEVSEFYMVLLSAVFMYISEVRDKN